MITIQRVGLSQADTLLSFSKETFYELFAGLNDPGDMEAYSKVAFTRQKIRSELANPGSEFYFALYEDSIIGYIKINFADAQTDLNDKNALEIERIYVSAESQGKRIGSELLNFAIERAINRRLDYIWLGVWEHNHKAIKFYERRGFGIFGSHEFLLGNDRQTDLLMRKSINPA